MHPTLHISYNAAPPQQGQPQPTQQHPSHAPAAYNLPASPMQLPMQGSANTLPLSMGQTTTALTLYGPPFTPASGVDAASMFMSPPSTAVGNALPPMLLHSLSPLYLHPTAPPATAAASASTAAQQAPQAVTYTPLLAQAPPATVSYAALPLMHHHPQSVLEVGGAFSPQAQPLYLSNPPLHHHHHNNTICRHFLDGRCTRRRCRFLHQLPQ